LVADGISEQAFLLKFLPLFFENVQSNSCLTLDDGLNLLLHTLGQIEDYAQQAELELRATTVVEISEIAKMAAEARTLKLFKQSVQALVISSSTENGARVFRASYPRDFWKLLLAKPGMNIDESDEKLVFTKQATRHTLGFL
jgi:hypothetical protein